VYAKVANKEEEMANGAVQNGEKLNGQNWCRKMPFRAKYAVKICGRFEWE
jgi:hypothetical protein